MPIAAKVREGTTSVLSEYQNVRNLEEKEVFV